MANKKNENSVCFDIGSLDHDQKVEFAKNLKTTVDKFNKKLSESNQEEESQE